jgi:sulfate transport system ATP-binding protein
MTNQTELRIDGISYHYGNFPAVDQVSFEVHEGELVTLLGPSGSGKSTILRLIAGLLQPSTGRVEIGGKDATRLPPQQRNVGFVFQQYALFRHMTVFDNVAFGLRVRRWAKDRIADRVTELLRMVQLLGEEHKRPAQLSGGQRQRVALARALAPSPRVLLLDEPFGAVDAKVRLELREWLRRRHDEFHVTSVFVTHDQEEALELSDRLVVLDHGRVEQIGTPDDIYEQPTTPFVTSFIGPVNQLLGEAGGGVAHAGGFTVPAAWANGDRIAALVMVRPGDVALTPGDAATVRRLVHIGDLAKVELTTTDGQLVTVHCSRQHATQLGLQPGVQVGTKLTRGWAYPRG